SIFVFGSTLFFCHQEMYSSEAMSGSLESILAPIHSLAIQEGAACRNWEVPKVSGRIIESSGYILYHSSTTVYCDCLICSSESSVRFAAHIESSCAFVPIGLLLPICMESRTLELPMHCPGSMS